MKIFTTLLIFVFSLPAFSKTEKYNVNAYLDAINEGDLEVIEEQLKLKVPVDTPIDVDDGPTSPLIVAIRNDNVKMYELLIKYGANVNGLKKGYVPIVVAIQKENKEIWTDLLKRNVNLSKKQVDLTVLMTAAIKSNPEALKMILEKSGSTINTQDRQGRTALSYAAERACVLCVKELLEKKAFPKIKDKEGKLPLDYVGEVPNKEELFALLEPKKKK